MPPIAARAADASRGFSASPTSAATCIPSSTSAVSSAHEATPRAAAAAQSRLVLFGPRAGDLKAGIVVQRVLGLRNLAELAPASPPVDAPGMVRRSAGWMPTAARGRRSTSRASPRIPDSCGSGLTPATCSAIGQGDRRARARRLGGKHGVSTETAEAVRRRQGRRGKAAALDMPTTQVRAAQPGYDPLASVSIMEQLRSATSEMRMPQKLAG